MPVYIVTGKLGGGKTLVSVARMHEYLSRGRRVATNLDLSLHLMFNKTKRNLDVLRLPDKPQVYDLDMIGIGNSTTDETKNGGLFLDEAGTWFNSRNWNDKSRGELINKLLHIRKLGWDMFLIIQDIDLLDSQARAALAEHVVFCRRLDRVAVPYLGRLIKMTTGIMLKGPRYFVGKVIYGDSPKGILSDTWNHFGGEHFRSYDTKQMFKYREPGPMTMVALRSNQKLAETDKGYVQPMADDYFGVHCMLTPWHLLGRYQKPWTGERKLRLTHIYLKKMYVPLAIGMGCFAGFLASVMAMPYYINKIQETAQDERVQLVSENAPVEPPGAGDAVPVDEEKAGRDESECTAMDCVFGEFSVSAHVRNSHDQYYLISSRDGRQFTDEQLISMGHRVFYVNECELMLTAASDMSDKVHIFAPGCSPRKTQKTALDLAEFPAMGESVKPLVPIAPIEYRQVNNVTAGDLAGRP